jgi:hypothetical protein
MGLEIEAPLPWAGLMLRIGGRYCLVMTTGEAGRAVAYAASVHGYEAQFELSGRIVAGFRYFATFEAFGFIGNYIGAGNEAEAEGSTDYFFRGVVGLAYAFDAG